MSNTLFQEIVGAGFRISLPDYMQAVEERRDAAVLHYLNFGKKLFVSLFEAEKNRLERTENDQAFNTYYDQAVLEIALRLTEAQVAYPIEKEQYGKSYIEGIVRGYFLGSPVIYFILVGQGERHYYKLLIWTDERVRNNVNSDIQTVMDSFQVLDKD